MAKMDMVVSVFFHSVICISSSFIWISGFDDVPYFDGSDEFYGGSLMCWLSLMCSMVL